MNKERIQFVYKCTGTFNNTQVIEYNNLQNASLVILIITKDINTINFIMSFYNDESNYYKSFLTLNINFFL